MLRPVRSAFAKVGRDSWGIEKVKKIECCPIFQVMCPAGAGKAWRGPSRGVGVEIANVEGRGDGV